MYNKEYHRNYYETHKEEIKEINKKYRENNKEKLNEKHKEYCKSHKDKIKEINKKYHNKYYESHKDEIKEINKKYREDHIEERREYDSNYYEVHKERYKKFNKYQQYVRRKYSRFISLENYIAIMKLEDKSLKRSIMTRLGMGLIDEDEAVMLSGMVFTEEDNKEMTEWYNVCKCDALA